MTTRYVPIVEREPPDPTPVRRRPARDRARSALDAAQLLNDWVPYRDALASDLPVLRRLCEEEHDKFVHHRGEFGNAWEPYERKRQQWDEAEGIVRGLMRQATGL